MPRTPKLCAENWDSIQYYEFSKAMHGKFENVISEEGLISARCDGTEKRLEECSLSVNNNCQVLSQKSFATVKSYQAI